MAIGAATLAAVFAVPAVANAAVNVSAGFDDGDYVVTVQGDDAAQNITVTSTATSVTFAASGEPMTAESGSDCNGTGPVTCDFDPSTDYVDVLLGSGNDVFDASAATEDLGLYVVGGDGADSIDGTSLADHLVGGAGIDRLSGLGGDDILDFRGNVNSSDDLMSDCGDGTTDLAIRDRIDFMPNASCEFVSPMFTSALGFQLRPFPGLLFRGDGDLNRPSVSYRAPSDYDIQYRYRFKVCTVGGPCNPEVAGRGIPIANADVGRVLSVEVDVGIGRFLNLGYFDTVRHTAAIVPRGRGIYSSNEFGTGAFKTGPIGLLPVRVPGAGKVVAQAPNGFENTRKLKRTLVRFSSKAATTASVVKLPIKLTAYGKKQLQRKRKLTVQVLVSFDPPGNFRAYKAVRVTFKLKPKKKTS